MGREWEITFEQTDELLRLAHRRYLRRHIRRPSFIIIVLAVVGIGLLYLVPGEQNKALKVALLFLALPLGFGFTFWRHGKLQEKYWRRFPGRVIRYVFDVAGIVQETTLSTSKITWSMIDRIWKFSELWLLFMGRTQYLIIPTEHINKELGELITTQVEAGGGVDYFKCPKCSYNLIGNESGTCPECGTVIPLEERGISREHFDELSAKLLREESDPK